MQPARRRSIRITCDALERFEQGFLHNILILTDGDQRQTAAMLGSSLPEL